MDDADRRFHRLFAVLLAGFVAFACYVARPRLHLPLVHGLVPATRVDAPAPETVRLAVPTYQQGDPAWGDDLLAGEPLRNIGCAVTSVAMVLSYHGVKVSPGELNAWLGAHGGYTKRGWIKWDKAASYSGGRVVFERAAAPDEAVIDDALAEGNPVIVQVLVGTITHWVVVVGRVNGELVVNDPLDDGAEPVPISRFASGIRALRLFRRGA